MELVELDETFHERLLAMSNNTEMLRVMRNVNARIRFVRWIDMDSINRNKTQKEHRTLLLGLKTRDESACAALLESTSIAVSARLPLRSRRGMRRSTPCETPAHGLSVR